MRTPVVWLHWRVARTLGIAAAALLGALLGCASAPPARLAAEGRVPDLAVAVGDTLYVRYPDASQSLILSAQWTEAQAGVPASSYRAARLEVVTEPADFDALASAGRKVEMLPATEWESLLRRLLADLAPSASGQAALAVVQGVDVVFTREAGELRIYRHERKPAALQVTSLITEEELSRRVSEDLAQRYGAEALVLFDTGASPAGRTLVLIDIARSQSVLMLPASQPAAATPPANPDEALSLTEALFLRSHVIAPLTQPLTSAARLTWLTLQTAIGLIPRPGLDAQRHIPAAGQAATMDLERFERSLDERFGTHRTQARLHLLVDGDAYFPHLVQAIQSARDSILIRLYIFDTDPYALQLADLLKERSKTIRVQVLLDHLGSLSAARVAGRLPYADVYPRAAAPRSIVEYLQADSNVKVRTVANPWFTSDHTKAVIIDGERAFLGGMNIGQEYRYEWHDLMVEVEGPVVAQLARDFELVWAQTAIGGDLAKLAQSLSSPPEPAMVPAGAVPVRTLYTRTANPQILIAQLAAIRSARQYIYVEQPYVSDDEMIAALVEARRRGVDVRVVLPTAGDSGFMNAANLVATNVFVRNGVRVYAFPGMTHAKAALYDGWACVGSANFDKLSLRINRELNVATSDPAFVDILRRELFERDFRRSREVTEPRSLGWSTYISSFIANQL
jgi:cardiolipin synthase A/B